MSKSFDRKKILIANGNFSFQSEGVFSWGLTFEKTGYYGVTVGMGVSNIVNGVKDGDKSLNICGHTITKTKKIILYPYGDFNRDLLSVDNHILTYSEIEVDKKRIECVVIPYEDKGKRKREDKEFIFFFTNEKKLPKNLIYIIPGRNKDGTHDGTIHLKSNGKDSGFHPVKYDGKHCFRNMWEAPMAGYQSELVLEDGLTNYLQHKYVKTVEIKSSGAAMRIANASALIPKEVPYTVFYFKVRGYYGKGLIMLADSDSKLEKNNASLKIYLYVNRYPEIRNTNIWLGTNW